MKIIIETEDEKEAQRLLKSLDMALVLWEINHNLFRGFENIDYEPVQEAINTLLYDHNIDIDSLID